MNELGRGRVARVAPWVLAIVAVVGAAGCSSVTQMRMPSPLQSHPELGATRLAIVRSLAARSWVVEQEGPDYVVDRLEQRSHTVRLLVRYDKEWVRFEYLDSHNLEYRVDRNGVAYIHKRYNTWVRSLAREIGQQMLRPDIVAMPPG